MPLRSPLIQKRKPMESMESKFLKHLNNTLNETLYGLRVTPGNKPIDQLIAAIDDLYMDFNPKDEKFKKLAIKTLGHLPATPQEWDSLIDNSSQSVELKTALKKILLPPLPQPLSQLSEFEPGNYRIKMRRGTIIDANYVGFGAGMYYFGFGPEGSYLKWKRGGSGKRPKDLKLSKKSRSQFYQRYDKIITAHPKNVKSITKI